MRLEELLKAMFHSFFVITTGIVASMFIFCLLFNQEACFYLSDIGRILLMAFVCDLLYIIFYSRRELSKMQMSVRFIIHFLVLLSILLYFANLWDWVEFSKLNEVIIYILLIIIVYVIVVAISTYQDKKLADKLNDSLRQRYHK